MSRLPNLFTEFYNHCLKSAAQSSICWSLQLAITVCPPQTFQPLLGLKPQPAHKTLASGLSEYQSPSTAVGGLLPEQITLTMQRNVYMDLNTRLSWDQNKGNSILATSFTWLPTDQISGPCHELGTTEFHSAANN